MSGNEDENQSNYSDESDGPEEHVQESLESTTKPKGRPNVITKEYQRTPLHVPGPSFHEEFLDILESVDRADTGTVIGRIRKLHHPSLGEMNKSKVQVCLVISRYLRPRLTLYTGSHFRPPGSHNLRLGRAPTRHYGSRCDPASFCRAQ